MINKFLKENRQRVKRTMDKSKARKGHEIRVVKEESNFNEDGQGSHREGAT